MLRVGSLFSGAGLCDLGLARAGFNHQFFCEVDPFCRAILARHWPGIPIHEDIRLVRGRALRRLPVPGCLQRRKTFRYQGRNTKRPLEGICENRRGNPPEIRHYRKCPRIARPRH